jgi:SAM-dependent methyltransferase
MIWQNPLRLLYLCRQAGRSLDRAEQSGRAELAFGRFGRQLGWRLLRAGCRSGVPYLITPVALTRYYEFGFTQRCLPTTPGAWADVSSPRLFSFYAASKFPSASILMLNPDEADLRNTNRVIAAAKLRNIQTLNAAVDWLESAQQRFDCIWSISVIEHISGAYADDRAARLMFDALRPGGRLILTVPVDRTAWDEYRDSAYYGRPTPQSKTGYFFQRWYDESAIEQRIIGPVGVRPTVIEWFGESEKDRFVTYEEMSIKHGWDHTHVDAEEYLRHYRAYPSWSEMPGTGVCGLLFEKPG